MFEIKKNKKNKSAVILNPERSEWVSRSHVTSVEPVVNDEAKTKRYSAKRDLYGDFAYAQPLKLTRKTLSFLRLRGASGAQGISAPASCREAHKRRFIFNSWILRFANAPFRMTIPTLALIFSIITISESLAAKTCDCGTAGHETECCWEITEVTKDGKTEKVLTISPGVDENGNTYTNVQMKNYKHSSEPLSGDTIHYSNAPWATKTVTSVKVEGGINNIGQYAFSGEKIKTFYAPEIKEIGYGAFYVASSLKDAYIPKVNKIEGNAFAYARALKSIEMPNVESIHDDAFYNTFSLKSVDIPNITELNGRAFLSSALEYIGFSTQKDSEGCLVNEKGERLKSGNSTCLTAVNISDGAFRGTKIPNCSADGSGCGSCGNDYIKSGLGCVSNCGSGYLEKEGRCIDSSLGCGAGYRQFEDFCNRIRYTPAEAAQVLRDDNTNEVTITFKK